MSLYLSFKALRLLTPMVVRLNAGRGLDYRVQKPRHVSKFIVQGSITECAPQRLAAFAADDTQGRVLDKVRTPFKRLEYPRPHCRPGIKPERIERIAQRIRSGGPQRPIAIVVHHAEICPPNHRTGKR